MWKKYCRLGQATDASALLAGYLSLQTHTHNMYYLLLFHGNNGQVNAPHYYVLRTLPVL